MEKIGEEYDGYGVPAIDVISGDFGSADDITSIVFRRWRWLRAVAGNVDV